jgi:hypothetical protein
MSHKSPTFSLLADVGRWHETENADCIAQCPLSGEKRKTLLALSFSQFDPKRPFGTQRLNFRHGWWKADPFGHLMFRGIPLLERYPE